LRPTCRKHGRFSYFNSATAEVGLEKVDVVAHSTGGLVTRAYIQSDAYGQEYAPGQRLPKIVHFVMYNVPNQGASKA
jgi:triacylglycerol esterase/lipase EstA (alpha/beta hydrolase family)